MNAKMITSAVVAGVVFCAVPVTADVTWSVDENGTGSAAGEGTLVLDESQSLSGLNVTSDALTLSGEGIVFTNAAPAVSIFGSAVLDLTLASTGSLSFVHSPGYDARTYADSFLSENYITVFNDMDLSEYYPLVALGAGWSMTDGIPLKPFHLVRGEGTLICQFQVVDAQWAKCVKVEFVQSGNDVQAKIVYVAYNDLYYYGSDFDSGSIPFVIAASSNSEGYNLKSITLVKGLDDAFLHINRKIDAASIVFGDSLTVTADPGNVLAGSGTVPPDMEINGTLVITNVQNMVFTNAISGNGSLYLGGLVKTIQPDKAEVVHDALMPAAWTNVVYDSIVTAITNVYINAFSGLAIPNKPGWIYHLKNDGMNVIGQCQVEDGS